MRMTLLRIALVLPLAWLPGTQSGPVTHPVAKVASEGIASARRALEERQILAVGRAAERDFDNPYIARSKYYEVHSTKSPRHARRHAEELDLLLPLFHDFFETDYEPETRFKVVIFPTNDEYRDYGDDFDEASSVTGAFYVNNGTETLVAADGGDDNENLLRMYLRYGATHQFMASAFTPVQIPVILEQGIAAYFALQTDTVLREFNWTQFRALCDSEGRRPWIPLQQMATNSLSDITELGRANDPLFELAYMIVYLRFNRVDSLENSVAEFNAYLADLSARRSVRNNAIHKELTTNIGHLNGVLQKFNGWRSE